MIAGTEESWVGDGYSLQLWVRRVMSSAWYLFSLSLFIIISSELHAIFAKEYKDGYFHCINSHGGEDPEPRVRKEQVTHLYYVAISRVPEDI